MTAPGGAGGSPWEAAAVRYARGRKRVFMEAVAKAFLGSDDRALRRRGWKILYCHTAWLHLATEGGRGRLEPLHCDDRLCPACSYHRSRKTRRFVAHKEATTRLRMLTLTQARIPGESCADALARLHASFRRWWRDPSRRVFIRGGMRRYEVTYNRELGWHWHAHLVYEGAFFPHRLALRSWEDAEGGSNVDVRAVYDARELFTYEAKVAPMPPGAIVEYARMAYRKRLFQPVGTWHGEKYSEDEDPGWFLCDPVQVEEAARDPDPGRREWARAVISGWNGQISALRASRERGLKRAAGLPPPRGGGTRDGPGAREGPA